MKKKFLTLLVVVSATSALLAANFEVDGIAYNILGGNSVEVTSKSPAYSDTITIPATVTYQSQTYRVTRIGYAAFASCTSLSSITIPNSVTSIGKSAFYGCKSLTSINVGASNKYYCLLDGVLFNYAKDTLIQYPVGNTRSLYTIPDSVTRIEEGGFYGCASLVSVTIPHSVTSIGAGAFSDCSSLASITIPDSVTSIEEAAFKDCTSLTSVTISNSVTRIRERAFNNCSSLTSLIIPSSVTSIGKTAFFGCSSLASITIPNSVTSIGDGAFERCTSLPVENNIRYADTYLVKAVDKTLSTYTIKKGIKWIGDAAFSGCTSLTSIAIPNSVTSIGGEVFYNCISLKSITIPNSVTSIGHMAFASCDSLTSITCEAVTPPTCGWNCFDGVDYTIPLYVLTGSITAYQDAAKWEDFTNIQAISAQKVEVTEVESEPESTSVVIAWPAVGGSDSYTIEIKQGSKVVCTLVFNAVGQLLSINNATAAPARGAVLAEMATETAIGWAYAIKGLTPGTAYTYSVVAKNAQGTTIDTKTGSFVTDAHQPMGMDEVDSQKSADAKVESQKFLRDGVLLIKRNGVHYNAQGAVVE